MMAEYCHYRPWKYNRKWNKNAFQTKLATHASILHAIKPMVHSVTWRNGDSSKTSSNKKTCDAKGKSSGGESIEAKDEIIGQSSRMTSEVMGKQQKCTRIEPREFVLFEFNKITFDNITSACQRYFAAPKNHHIASVHPSRISLKYAKLLVAF